MAEKITKDVQNLVEAIAVSMKAEPASAIENYLLCGTSDGYNYNGRLTPKIFFDYFYVKPSSLNRIRANKMVRINQKKAIQELFNCLNSEQENFVILSGPAGSGKSTFLTGFSQIINNTSAFNRKKVGEINTIRLDCASSSDYTNYNDISMKFPMEQLIQAYNTCTSELEKEKNKTWKEKYEWLLKALQDKAALYNRNKSQSRGYPGQFVDFLDANKIINVEKCSEWMNKSSVKSISLIERQFAISLLVLMLACKISTAENRERYILFFDNLEMYIYHTDQPIFGYVSIAKDLYALFSELPNLLGVDERRIFTSTGYMTHFTIALCLRTSTRNGDIEYLTSDGVPNQWERDTVRVIDLPTYDFSPIAIQKKLRFLQTHEALKPYFNDVYSYVDPLYDIKVEEPVDDEVAAFSSNYYFPFNNCNYRIVIITLEEMERYRGELEKLENVLYYIGMNPSCSELVHYIKNGKRMIATRSRYEFLHDQKYLEQLGILNFGDEHRQSNVRAVLNFILFKSICDERNGTVNFLDLKNDIRLIPSKFFKDIADVVIALGPVSCNKIREEALRKWGALISISGISSDKGISEEIKCALKEDKRAAKIQLNLTPAGRDYVLNESKQFEYFLFRITDDKGNRLYKPLFSYLEMNDVQDALKAISAVYTAVQSYAEDFSMDCPSLENCELMDCRECFARKPTLCMTVIRAFDFFSIIRKHIDYIDRYRCVLIANLLRIQNHNKKHFSVDLAAIAEIQQINCQLVDLLASFIGLYDRMETRLKEFEVSKGNLYGHILDVSTVMARRIDSNDIMPYYHLPSGKFSSGNRFKQGSNSLNKVLEMAKQIDVIHFEKPTRRLYYIMDEVYEET